MDIDCVLADEDSCGDFLRMRRDIEIAPCKQRDWLSSTAKLNLVITPEDMLAQD